MIRLQDIRYRYPQTGWVLKGIDFSVKDCEYLFIGGANGSGKSTLAYLFNGLIPHYFGGTLQGTVTCDGLNTLEHKVFELFSSVGLVLQNADAQLFNSTVENEIAFGLESLGLPGKEIDNRIQEIAHTLTLEDLLQRSPATLSGGEKRLVAIASVLCLNPSVLLLDEPYGDLDWEAVERVRQALSEVNRSGKTVVVIEQRMGKFLYDTSRCLILAQGKLLYDGSPQSAHEAILNAHLLPQYSTGGSGTPGKEPLLIAQDLSYRIMEKDILKGVSLELREGETLALIGRNGSGKTTLLKHFNGLLRPTSGRLTLKGEKIQDKAPSELAAQVGLSFQNPNDQFFKYRVKDEVMAGPRILRNIQEDWLREIWQIFDLHELMDRSPYRLSEGEKKRVALASILATQPKLLVLDEPTSGQDGRFREALANLMAELKTRGFTMVIATHDLGFAQATADRWVVLHEGRVVGGGAPEDLWGDERLIKLGALPRPEEHFINSEE